MKWVDDIFSFVWDISDWFLSLYQATRDIWLIGSPVANIFYSLHNVFWSLLTPIANFGDWADDVWGKVQNTLTSEGILGLIKGWFPWIATFGDWFTNVNAWFETGWKAFWGTVIPTVQGWINTAVEGLPALKVAWGNFFTVTLPTLFDLKYAEEWWKGKALDVSALIGSKLKEWFPQYDTEAEQQATRISFFRSPLDWLLEQFTDWFLGKE